MRYCQEKGIVCQYAGTNMHCRLTACVFPGESLYPTASGGGHLMDIEKLIEQLSARGLSNGSSLGYHSGLFDEAATALSTLRAENEEMREKLEQVKRDRDAARSDIETALAYGMKDCEVCKNSQCYVRGGTKPCLPKWRGQKKD